MIHILYLMSDTGGGHRAASRAIQAALEARYPGRFSAELVDMWKDYTPHPFSTMPTTYTRWVNESPATYGAQFWFNDRLFRLKPVSAAYCRIMFPRMRRLYRDHPSDMIVCVHSVFVRPAVYALRRLEMKQPFVTVITDWALPTVLWYDARADRTLVPTEPALELGRALRIPEARMVLTGAPIHPRFTEARHTRSEARTALGWPPDKRIVLLVGGGDGMGPLVETAQAIDSRQTGCELVIVAGRNEALKTKLEGLKWQGVARIYGFVDNMPVMMRAADLLVTKAGPATITEAAAMGLPMIIKGAIPYQETPNALYVAARNAGIYAPSPELVGEEVARLMSQPESLQALAEGVTRIAQPDAIWRIADEIAAAASVPNP